MTISEFQSLYLSEHPFMWLALATLLGVFVGVRVGRWLERARSGRKKEVVAVPSASTGTSQDQVTDEQKAAPVDESQAQEQAEPAVESDAPVNKGIGSDGYVVGDLTGITDKHVNELNAHGISTVIQLREATATKGAREHLADELQLEDFVVNKWARMADFLSLDGMTPETAEFLVFAGINSTNDLASRNPESVAHKLQNLNEKESRIEAAPTRQQLESWITAISA